MCDFFVATEVPSGVSLDKISNLADFDRLGILGYQVHAAGLHRVRRTAVAIFSIGPGVSVKMVEQDLGEDCVVARSHTAVVTHEPSHGHANGGGPVREGYS